GLPFLILEYLYESPRKRPLTVAGPRRLEQRVWAAMSALYHEYDPAKVARIMRFIVIEPERPARVGGFRIDSFRTPHTRRDVSLALRLALDGKRIAFSGDTGWTERLLPFSESADLFLCECTYF